MTTALCKGRALGGWRAQAAQQTSVRYRRANVPRMGEAAEMRAAR